MTGKQSCVAIFGASGFLGGTLAERMMVRAHDVELRLLIRSANHASRLAAQGSKLTMCDVLNRADVFEQVRGCTHVVNCTMGTREAMLEGLKNLLDASRVHRVS